MRYLDTVYLGGGCYHPPYAAESTLCSVVVSVFISRPGRFMPWIENVY